MTEPNDGIHISNEITKNIVETTEVKFNLGQKVITTTEDKIRLAVLTHLSRLADKNAWQAPAGIFATIVLAFVTADFKDYYLPAATWRAVFVIAGALTVYWFVTSLWRAFTSPTLEDFVQKLREQDSPAENKGAAKYCSYFHK